MGLSHLDINGPPEARGTAIFICDVCQEPILGPYAGNIVWLREHPPSDPDRPRLFGSGSVHKGACDQAWTASMNDAHPGAITQWNDIEDVARQLLHHAENEFVPNPTDEYVAPHPSTWRVSATEVE